MRGLLSHPFYLDDPFEDYFDMFHRRMNQYFERAWDAFDMNEEESKKEESNKEDKPAEAGTEGAGKDSKKATDAAKETKKTESKESKKTVDEKKTTEGESEEKPKSMITRASYSNINGVVHSFTESYNSETGETESNEVKKIGKKQIKCHKVTDKEGHTSTEETVKNLADDHEKTAFNEEWEQIHNKNPSVLFVRRPLFALI